MEMEQMQQQFEIDPELANRIKVYPEVGIYTLSMLGFVLAANLIRDLKESLKDKGVNG